MKAELFISVSNVLGEGPVWDYRSNELLWVDIEQCELHIYHFISEECKKIRFNNRLSAIVPCEEIGIYLLALQNGLFLWNRKTNSMELLSNPEEHIPNNRFNDGKCDWEGNFWIGSMDLQATVGKGALYCVGAAGNIIPKLSELSISNGIAFNRSKNKMYFIDTASYSVVAYNYDAGDTTLLNLQKVIHVDPSLGAPDGMCIDEEGMLWIAHWGGAQIIRWNPETCEILQKVEVPAKQVTSCCFGGENLDTLFITSARIGLSEKEISQHPESGCVFQYKTTVKGVKTNFYKRIQSNTI